MKIEEKLKELGFKEIKNNTLRAGKLFIIKFPSKEIIEVHVSDNIKYIGVYNKYSEYIQLSLNTIEQISFLVLAFGYKNKNLI